MRVNPEKKEEKERITQALLRATLRLAATHGFVSLGLREVSRAADIAPTSFYRHFADMEALGLALIEDEAGRLLAESVTRAEQSAARGRVDAIALELLASAAADPELMRFILAERVGAIPAFRAALGARLSTLRTAVQRALDAEHGTGRVPSHAADAAVVLMLEASSLVLEHGLEHDSLRDELLSQIRALVSGALAAEGAR